MHISHNRNLILGGPIKGEGLHSVGYGQILYQKTFRRALSTLAHGFKGESEDAMVRVGTASVTPDTIHVPMRYGRAHRLHPAGNRPWHRGGVIQVIAVPADRQSQGPVVPGSNANVHRRWQ